MTVIKTLNQARFDKELRQLIDHLSSIKIDYKLNSLEQSIIDESGETSLLYTMCLLKVVMGLSDVDTRKNLGIRVNFYKYLKGLLKEEYTAFNNIVQGYVTSLSEFDKVQEDEIDYYLTNFFVQGHDYVRENYYPEDSPFKDPEFIDKIIELEDTIEQIQQEELESYTLITEFEKSSDKVKGIALKLNNNNEKLMKNLVDPSKITREDLSDLILTTVQVLEEYEYLTNLMICSLEKIEIAKGFCDEFTHFIKAEGLVEKFNKDNKYISICDVQEYNHIDEVKKQNKKSRKPGKKGK
jgi:hypothetical protein